MNYMRRLEASEYFYPQSIVRTFDEGENEFKIYLKHATILLIIYVSDCVKDLHLRNNHM